MKVNNVLCVLSFLLILNALPAFSFNSTDSLLNELSKTIENSEIYREEKNSRIEKLRKELNIKSELSLSDKFAIYEKLYKEYRSFKYDSAFAYALKLQQVAEELNDSSKISYAKMQKSFTLLSSGMYKEAFEQLETIDSKGLPDNLLVDYYDLMSRAYYDLANYNLDNYYASRYLEKGNLYADSAISISDKDTQQFYYLRGMKNMKLLNFEEAENDFLLILDKFKPTSHNYAIVVSTLAGVYLENGESNKALDWIIRAAIADIKSATTEAIALINLADILYRRGDVERAYGYINKALEDADFYGARQRKIQASAILPIIEGAQMARVEKQRARLMVYAVAVSLLTVIVIAFAFIIFKQLKQLRLAKKTVTEANINLQEVNNKLNYTNEVLQITNSKLNESNSMLQETNEKLLEANKIKEEYIGYSFNMYNEYIEKIDRIKKDIKRAKNNNNLNIELDRIDIDKEREALYLNFDKIFIKLFPNFISSFNTFFKEEDRFTAKDDGSLDIELRIFALIRIGIHDHEQIASMLEYSIRTIYNYKTKVKNKSVLSNEEFERRIMEIKAF